MVCNCLLLLPHRLHTTCLCANLTCAYAANIAPAQTPHLHDRGPLLAFTPQPTVTQVARHCSTAAAQQHSERCYSRFSHSERFIHAARVTRGCAGHNALFLSKRQGWCCCRAVMHAVMAVCLAQLPRTTATLPTKQRRPTNCERAHGCWPRPVAQASSCTSAAVWHYNKVLKAVHDYMQANNGVQLPAVCCHTASTLPASALMSGRTLNTWRSGDDGRAMAERSLVRF
jgi:hypothetical protein